MRFARLTALRYSSSSTTDHAWHYIHNHFQSACRGQTADVTAVKKKWQCSRWKTKVFLHC